MIKILKWNYEKIEYKKLLDFISRFDRLDSVDELCGMIGFNKSSVNRMIKQYKDEGLLSSFRYKDNNFIWCIGDDVANLANAHDAIATARYRKMIESGGDAGWFEDATGEEQENMLIDVPVFDSEKKSTAEDLGYEYYPMPNVLRKVKAYPVSQELHEEVENMWV